MISSLLIYKSEQFNPYLNLATEKYLFENLPKNALILYLWQNENTVVIGKNQNPWAECNCELLKNEGGFVMRRMSGGGAVFHDKGNQNFTFIASEENFDVSRHFEIIKKGCELCGIETELSGRNDILANGRKFSGNAFHHSGGNSYQHGTLLLSTSREKLQKYLTPNAEKLKSKGVKSVNSRTINLCEINPEITPKIMQNALIKAAEETLHLEAEFFLEIDTKKIKKDAEALSDWNFIFGNTLPFQATVSGRLSFGSAELNLSFKNGKIDNAKLFTDALDTTISEKVETALIECEFSIDAIREALEKTFESDVVSEILTLIEKALMQ